MIDIKTNLKNHKNKINTYMVEKFRDKFNKNPSGVVLIETGEFMMIKL